MKYKYILLLTCLLTLCTGCSSFTKEETNIKQIEEKLETIIVEQDETELLKEIIDGEATITETKKELQEGELNEITLDNLTKDMLLSMPLEDLKIFVEKYLSGYRETYHIEEDRILTDEDWENLRILISLSLFGSSTPDAISDSFNYGIKEIHESIDMEIIKNDENSIYYAPSIYDIENMSLKAFAEYLNGMYIYYRGENENANFSQLDNESLQLLKDQYIESLKAQNSQYIEGSIEEATEVDIIQE